MSANDDLYDKTIRRRIFIERLSTKQARELGVFLDQVRMDLEAKIRSYEGTNLNKEIVLRRQLEALDEMIADNYGRLSKKVREQQRSLAKSEAIWNNEKLASLGLDVEVQAITGSHVYGAMRSKPAHGLFVPKMVQALGPRAKARLEQALRISYVEGESLSATISRVKGITGQNRRGLEVLVRTANAHIATVAKQEHVKANKEYYDRYRWSSILDRRTTPICRSRDGREWKLSADGEYLGPTPPAHMMCRSEVVELLANVPSPETLTYGAWLGRQNAAAQNEILGPARGKLFREGKFTVQTFVDNKGKLIRLDELAK